MTQQSCSITATNYTTPHDLIFPHKAGIIMVPEVNKYYAIVIDRFEWEHLVIKKILLLIYLGCKTWHNARLCDCKKKSTLLEGCPSRIAWIAIICHSPKNCFTINDRRHHYIARSVRFWNEIHVPFDFTRQCKYSTWTTIKKQKKKQIAVIYRWFMGICEFVHYSWCRMRMPNQDKTLEI